MQGTRWTDTNSEVGRWLMKEGQNVTKKMPNMQVQRKRRSGRPKKRWIDNNIRDDMKVQRIADCRGHGTLSMTKAGPLLHGGL